MPKKKNRAREMQPSGGADVRRAAIGEAKGSAGMMPDGTYAFASRDGVVLCELRLQVADSAGEGRAGARARQLADAYRAGAIVLARERLFPIADTAYLSDSDPKKRFTTRRYIVTLEGLRLPAPEGTLSLRFCLTVERGGKRLFSLTRGAVIDRRGRLCPHTAFTPSPIEAKMQFFASGNAKKYPRRISTWYIDGTRAVLVLRGGGGEDPECVELPIKSTYK